MLCVSDLEASIALYTKALDLQVPAGFDTLIPVGPDGSEAPRPVCTAFLEFPGQDFGLEL